MSANEIEVNEELARTKKRAAIFLKNIRLDYREGIDTAIENEIDVNYTDENNTLPIIAAIDYVNDYAFENLLKHPKFDIRKISFLKWGPLASAADLGQEAYLQALLDYDPRPEAAKAYYGFTLLSAALEGMNSYTILEYSSFNEDDPRIHGNDANLKKELADFFYQRGKYAKELDEWGGVTEQGIPFQRTLSKPLQVLYLGKPEILGLLLSRGANPSIPASGTDRSALTFVENPVKYARYPRGGKREQTQYLGNEGNGVLKYSMKFHNRAQDCDPIELIVYYDTNPSKKVILGFQQQLFERERTNAEALSKKVEDDVAVSHQIIARRVQDETARLDRGLFYLDGQVQMNQMAVHTLGYQVQTNGMTVQTLAYNVQPAILASQEEALWRSRREGVRIHNLAEKFCVTLDLGLRANVAASVVLASGKVERKEGLGESILTGALQVIGDNVPMFGGIIKLLAKGAEIGFDWHASKLHKATASLFAFVKVEEVCDRTAIEVTECCMHLLTTGIIKNEKHAERLAINALGFLLYTMSTGAIKPEQNLREQLNYYFMHSKIFEKHQKIFVEHIMEQATEQPPLVFSNNGTMQSMVSDPTNLIVVQPANSVNGHANSVRPTQKSAAGGRDTAQNNSKCCTIL